MSMGKVLDYIHEEVTKSPIHMTLIDPEKQKPEEAGKMASRAQSFGTSAVMIGGSTGVGLDITDRTVREIKSVVSLPVIAFPSSAGGLSPRFDAVYFLSMLNSTNPRRITGEQAFGSLVVQEFGIEPIGMGYIVVEPGMKVAEVGEADIVMRKELRRATGYALAAEYFGMKLVYLEAGSGANLPVPPDMITAVKKQLTIPLIVGGGIRNADSASTAVRAGADIVVTGTVIEKGGGLEKLKKIIGAVRTERRPSLHSSSKSR